MLSSFDKLPIIILFAALIVAAWAILSAPHDVASAKFVTIAGHDWGIPFWRILGLGDAFSQGEFGTWLQSFSYGWGYPLYQFTNPLPYALGASLYALGLNSSVALNVVWLVAIFGAGLAMYWSCLPILGRWGAMLAAIAYTFAPYHLVDIYVRTAVAEAFAFIFAPLLLRATWFALRQEWRPALLSGVVAVVGLVLTHFLSVYLVGVGMVVFSVVFLLLHGYQRAWDAGARLFVVVAIGFLLSAYYWVPVLSDVGPLKVSHLAGQGKDFYYAYALHFVEPWQWLSTEWAYGGSEPPGKKDYMSFSLGVSHVVLVAASLVLLFCRFVFARQGSEQVSSGRRRSVLVLLVAAFIAGVFCVWMTAESSVWLWRSLPRIDSVAFPWRFLQPATLFIALLIGALPLLLRECFFLQGVSGERYSAFLAVVLSALILAAEQNHAKAGSYGFWPAEKHLKASYIKEGLYTTNFLEFVPLEMKRLPSVEDVVVEKNIVEFQENYVPIDGRIANVNYGHGWVKVKLLPGEAGTLVVRQHWYPAWQAYVDGQPREALRLDGHPLWPIAVDVHEGEQWVTLRYGYSDAGRWGVWISAIVALGLLVWVWRRQPRHLAVWLGFVALGLLPASIELFKEWQSRQVPSVGDPVKVQAPQLTERRSSGSLWNQQGNVLMGSGGAMVHFSETQSAPYLEFSVDGNDDYLLVWQQGNKSVAQKTIMRPPTNWPGMVVRGIEVPVEAVSAGYDNIRIQPLAGDGYYSLGHLLAHDASSEVENWPSIVYTAQQSGRQLQVVTEQQLPPLASQGTLWNAPRNILFDEKGVAIQFTERQNVQRLRVGLDGNDDYRVLFWRGDQLLHHTALAAPMASGIFHHMVKVPNTVFVQGFDRVEIIPIAGDGYYSLAGMELE
jgi:hypothetical protein